MITAHADAMPDKPAVIVAGSGETLRFGELESRSRQLARLLRARGLGPGDRVAILMENRPEWFVATWAVRRSSLYFVPINWHLKPAEARYVVEDSNAKVIITSAKLLDLATDITRDNPNIRVRLTVDDAMAGFESLAREISAFPPERLEDEREGAGMLYSSGTSGRPKGIVRPLSNAPFGTVSDYEKTRAGEYQFGRDTVYLSPAPQYHTAPSIFTTRVQAFGGTVVMIDPFDPEGVLKAIETYRVTHAQFVPTHFVRMLRLPDAVKSKYDHSSLRYAIHAAAPCPPEIKLQMMEWWGPIIHEYYGGSEGFGVTSITPEEWLAHRGSVGKSRIGAVHIVDPASGKLLPPHEVGLIYFENAQGFTYHNDPEKTRETVTASGWGAYGDMGWVDEEGYLYLADRKSNMIISGGVNIYPQEVENALIAHPAVADVAVIGVPNAEFGEEVKAVVQLQSEARPSKELAAELIAFCKAAIAGFKCPKSVDFVDELPRHPNGKLLKRELRDKYWGEGKVKI